MTRFEIPVGWTAQAYRYALDPTPSQQRAFRSHAGGARKAHNVLLAAVKAVLDQRSAERSYGIPESGLTPDGREAGRVPAPKPLARAQIRLRTLQRGAARQMGPYDTTAKTKQEPSKRWLRTQARIGKAHARAAAVRRDVLHKATTALAQHQQVITVETLNVSGMRASGGSRKRGLNRALADAALAEVRRMLCYKTKWYGSALVQAGRYYPSTKLCSACGRRKPNLTLADRTYACDRCGVALDRDLNAAINLARLGDALHAGETRTGTGSSPAARHQAGDGRGAMQETADTTVANAAGHEASTPHQQAHIRRGLSRRKAGLPDGIEHAHVCSPEGNGNLSAR